MNPCSFEFLLFVSIIAAFFHICQRDTLRRFILTGVNAYFLLSVVQNLRSGVWLAVFVLGSYVVLRLLKAFPSRRFVIIAITGLVGVFAYLKGYDWLAWIPRDALGLNGEYGGIELVGISYMLFKAIHMAVDQWEGQLMPYNLSTYLCYQLSFFTLLAGPIQRYNDFQTWWGSKTMQSANAPDMLYSWGRIFLGMLQMGVIAAVFWRIYDNSNSLLHNWNSSWTLFDFACRFYAYPLYLYFNFSGYSSIAVGCAGLFGLRLPENFNYPFIARNMLDFWNRWHISLTMWIRDYIFMSSYKRCAERFPSWNRVFGPALLLLAMFIAGVWHGSTYAFAVFGLIHGVGVAMTQMYGDFLRARFGAQGLRRYLQNNLIHAFAIIITFHYFSFSLLFFSSGITQALKDLQRLLDIVMLLETTTFMVQAATWLAILAMVWALGVVLLAWQGKWTARLDGLVQLFKPKTALAWYASLCGSATVLAFALLLVMALQQKEQVLVYMRF